MSSFTAIPRMKAHPRCAAPPAARWPTGAATFAPQQDDDMVVVLLYGKVGRGARVAGRYEQFVPCVCWFVASERFSL